MRGDGRKMKETNHIHQNKSPQRDQKEHLKEKSKWTMFFAYLQFELQLTLPPVLIRGFRKD